jgi:hypothetical protein
MQKKKSKQKKEKSIENTKNKENIENEESTEFALEIEQVIDFCADVSEYFVTNSMDERFNAFTAIVGLEVISKTIGKRMGLNDQARQTIIKTAKPFVDKILNVFQNDDEGFEKVITEILRLQEDGSVEEVYTNKNEVVKSKKTSKKVKEIPLNPKACVKVGPPIFFRNSSRFLNND